MVAEQPSIFVSYAHEDSQVAHELAHAMERHGARVWLDQGELLVGDSLIARISEAIAEFDFVVALVSRHSVASNWCQRACGCSARIEDINSASDGEVIGPVRNRTPAPPWAF